METIFETQTDLMDWVANLLTETFIDLLYKLGNEKNYYTHVGIIAELLEWSVDFTDQYYYKVIDWEIFKRSNENIYNADSLQDFVIAFGHERVKKIYSGNECNTSYFICKYIDLHLKNNDAQY